MAILPGFSFLFRDHTEDDHLYFVISDTSASEVVIVSFTSWNPLADQACVLDVGDHPFIKHKTCMAYDYADVVATTLLKEKLANLDIVPRESATSELMYKIWDGAARTNRMKLRCHEILKTQGLI